MATLEENVAKVVQANADIKSALEAQGVDVSDYSRLSQAAAKIAAIEKGLDPQTIADAVSSMDGSAHAATETAAALAEAIKTITRRGNRRVIAAADGSSVTEDDIANMTWDVTPGVTAFAVAVSDTWADGTTRPRGLQFTLGVHWFLSGHTTYSVDWGDGTKSENISDEHPTHTYAAAGVYKIELSDDFSRFIAHFVEPSYGSTYIWGAPYEFVPVGTWSQEVSDGQTAGYWDADNRSKIVRALQWGASVTNATRTYCSCTGLTGSVPEWGASITNAGATYYNCAGLTGSVPEWGAAITNASGTYRGCASLTGVWDEEATDDELMPSHITSHSNTFQYCNNLLRAYFLTTWGGSRAS